MPAAFTRTPVLVERPDFGGGGISGKFSFIVWRTDPPEGWNPDVVFVPKNYLAMAGFVSSDSVIDWPEPPYYDDADMNGNLYGMDDYDPGRALDVWLRDGRIVGLRWHSVL